MKKSKSRNIESPRQSVRGLARVLNISVITIRKYLKQPGAPGPGADKLFTVAKVKEFIDPTLSAIKAEHREADLGFARLELERARGSGMPAAEIDATCTRMAVGLNDGIRATFETPEFLKQLERRAPHEAEKVIVDAYVEFVEAWRNGGPPPQLKADTEAGARSTDPKLQLASIAAEIRGIELKLARRELVPMAEIDAVMKPAITRFSTACEAEFEYALALRLRGLSASEMVPLFQAARFRVVKIWTDACGRIMTPEAHAALLERLGNFPSATATQTKESHERD
ncbi:MAG TPA: hypothetical protein PKX00_13015 [Opitutaceae bacterium]|nr:hypothetical protein [Opitutaceae bacterium]